MSNPNPFAGLMKETLASLISEAIAATPAPAPVAPARRKRADSTLTVRAVLGPVGGWYYLDGVQYDKPVLGKVRALLLPFGECRDNSTGLKDDSIVPGSEVRDAPAYYLQTIPRNTLDTWITGLDTLRAANANK